MNRYFAAICLFALLLVSIVRAEFDPAQQLQQADPTNNVFENYANQPEQAPQQQGQQPQQQQQQQQLAPQAQKQVFTDKDKNRIIDDPQVLLSLSEEERKKAIQDGAFNFTDRDAFIDVEDAMHSKRFIHRHLLSKTIADSEPLKLNRYFVNLMTTTSYVHQEGDGVNVKWVEYVAGGMTLSGGYTTESRHSFELGISFSSISYVFGGYRHYFGNDNWDVWPFAGASVGLGMEFLDIADGPFEVQAYKGPTTVLSAVGGILMPLPDIGIKLQVRVDMWGGVRATFTPGFGIILYL